MKEIFDWLREKINKNIYSIPLQNNHGVKFRAIDIADVENIINEAEAKWKEDCCEWFKYDYRTLAPRHHDVGNPYWRIPENMDKLKFCPYCGKEIKIVEVE